MGVIRVVFLFVLLNSQSRLKTSDPPRAVFSSFSCVFMILRGKQLGFFMQGLVLSDTLSQLEMQKYSFLKGSSGPTWLGSFASLGRHHRQHQQRHHGHPCPQLLSIHSEKTDRSLNTPTRPPFSSNLSEQPQKSVTFCYFGGTRQMKGGREKKKFSGLPGDGGMAWRGSISHLLSVPLSRIPISTL